MTFLRNIIMGDDDELGKARVGIRCMKTVFINYYEEGKPQFHKLMHCLITHLYFQKYTSDLGIISLRKSDNLLIKIPIHLDVNINYFLRITFDY